MENFILIVIALVYVIVGVFFCGLFERNGLISEDVDITRLISLMVWPILLILVLYVKLLDSVTNLGNKIFNNKK